MTNEIKEHWAEIKEIREQLQHACPDGAVYLVSIYDRKKRVIEGRMFVATPHIAAMMLAQKTHRLAVRDEIETWKSEQTLKGQKQSASQAKRESKINLDMGTNLASLLEQIRLMQGGSPIAAAAPATPQTPPAARPEAARHSTPVKPALVKPDTTPAKDPAPEQVNA